MLDSLPRIIKIKQQWQITILNQMHKAFAFRSISYVKNKKRENEHITVATLQDQKAQYLMISYILFNILGF